MLKVWLAAIAAELAAFTLLVRGEDAAALLGFLGIHAVASALAAAAAGALFPPAYRRPRRLVWGLLFGLNFFAPLLGLTAYFLGIWGGHWFPQLLKPKLFNTVAQPEYTVTRDDIYARLRGAAARARLLNRAAPQDARVEALLTVGQMPSPATGVLLRELLSDPSDDMRLLAYGLLDRREKHVSNRLATERVLLEAATEVGDRDSERLICGRIAQLYWELVYQGLAQGDTARYALEQTLIHAERALRDDASDGPRWLLIARTRLRRRELPEADAALAQALSYGMPRVAVLPYLAELRFEQGRYEEVRAAMFELGATPGSETLAAMQQYWAV